MSEWFDKQHKLPPTRKAGRFKKLLIFGDSHSTTWRTRHFAPNKEVFHLGAALAFNLINIENNEQLKWGKEVFSILEKNQPLKDCAVMLCFGEIDIRTQVIKRAIRNHTNIEHEANKIAKKLITFAKMLYEKFGLIIFIWEPVATMSSGFNNFHASYPTVGSEQERNYATRIVSTELRKKSNELLKLGFQIYSFGICEKLAPNYLTDRSFYEDGVHLTPIGLGLGVLSFKKLCKSHNLSKFNKFLSFRLAIKTRLKCFLDYIGKDKKPQALEHTITKDYFLNDRPKKINYTDKVKISLSSSFDDFPQLKAKENSGYCFHTNCDDLAFAVIDLVNAHSLNLIEIWNRFDSKYERAKKLQVLVGNDLNKMNIVFDCNNGVWGLNSAPIRVDFQIEFEPCRFILLRLKEKNYFHLGEVKIFINSFFLQPSGSLFL